MRDGFPERLKQLRTQRRVSQRALSELCGLGKNTISRYENGEIVPTLSSLEAMADYFGVTLDDLAGRGKILGTCDFEKRP